LFSLFLIFSSIGFNSGRISLLHAKVLTSGLQAALLPKPYREAFGHVFDRAPSVSYAEVVGVFQKDLGCDPDDIFETFSHEPLASASIAQVHKATLRPREGGQGREGVEVAVKVQKPAIEKQMDWDLFSYRWVKHDHPFSRDSYNEVN